METSIINRWNILKWLTLAMGASIVPKYAIAALGNHNDIKISSDDGFQPVHIKNGEGKNGKIGDGDIIFKLDKTQTDGHLTVTESSLPVGILGAPPHSHKGFDEICRVTQGTLTILVGEKIFEFNEGDWHLRPRGVMHTFWNSGNKPAKFIET